jgi:hypothetical protein
MSSTMSDDLLKKVTKAIEATGFPLELETATIARRLGWHDFHSVEYEDPDTGKIRELDLLLYRLVNQRRIELRVSCKSSSNKQFVFFARNMNYIRCVGDLKITPVVDAGDEHRSIPQPLKGLPCFSAERDAVNYTVFSGERVDREAKALLRDALLSTVTSIHHRILPDSLLFDERGTVYLFVVVLRGRMFEATFNENTNKMDVAECDYARWSGRYSVPSEYFGMEIRNAIGHKVDFSDVFYWFGEHVIVDFVRDTHWPNYLTTVHECFDKLKPDEYRIFGKPWTDENFPATVGPSPRLTEDEPKT